MTQMLLLFVFMASAITIFLAPLEFLPHPDQYRWAKYPEKNVIERTESGYE